MVLGKACAVGEPGGESGGGDAESPPRREPLRLADCRVGVGLDDSGFKVEPGRTMTGRLPEALLRDGVPRAPPASSGNVGSNRSDPGERSGPAADELGVDCRPLGSRASASTAATSGPDDPGRVRAALFSAAKAAAPDATASLTWVFGWMATKSLVRKLSTWCNRSCALNDKNGAGAGGGDARTGRVFNRNCRRSMSSAMSANIGVANTSSCIVARSIFSSRSGLLDEGPPPPPAALLFRYGLG